MASFHDDNVTIIPRCEIRGKSLITEKLDGEQVEKIKSAANNHLCFTMSAKNTLLFANEGYLYNISDDSSKRFWDSNAFCICESLEQILYGIYGLQSYKISSASDLSLKIIRDGNINVCLDKYENKVIIGEDKIIDAQCTQLTWNPKNKEIHMSTMNREIIIIKRTAYGSWYTRKVAKGYYVKFAWDCIYVIDNHKISKFDENWNLICSDFLDVDVDEIWERKSCLMKCRVINDYSCLFVKIPSMRSIRVMDKDLNSICDLPGDFTEFEVKNNFLYLCEPGTNVTKCDPIPQSTYLVTYREIQEDPSGNFEDSIISIMEKVGIPPEVTCAHILPHLMLRCKICPI